jgi:hypothetical protein
MGRLLELLYNDRHNSCGYPSVQAHRDSLEDTVWDTRELQQVGPPRGRHSHTSSFIHVNGAQA